MKKTLLLTAVLLSLYGCESNSDDAIPAYFADTVVSAPRHGSGPFSDSAMATNGVRGGGCTAGSTDVFTIDYDSSGGTNAIVLSWTKGTVKNGSGADIVVFENPFKTGTCSSSSTFMDHIIVAVSRDKSTWVTFPHNYTAPDEKVYSNKAHYWQGFAGITPALYHSDDNRVDPFDQGEAGGDHFDLDDRPDTTEGNAIKAEGFTYIRLTSAASQINPDTGETFVKDGISDGPDIDGIAARYF